MKSLSLRSSIEGSTKSEFAEPKLKLKKLFFSLEKIFWSKFERHVFLKKK